MQANMVLLNTNPNQRSRYSTLVVFVFREDCISEMIELGGYGTWYSVHEHWMLVPCGGTDGCESSCFRFFEFSGPVDRCDGWNNWLEPQLAHFFLCDSLIINNMTMVM